MTELIKINKTKARNLYNSGKSIYVVPCKVYPDFNNNWIQPFEMNMQRVLDEYEGYPDLIELHGTFDSRVNNYEFYNCNPELGNYSHFYIKKSE